MSLAQVIHAFRKLSGHTPYIMVNNNTWATYAYIYIIKVNSSLQLGQVYSVWRQANNMIDVLLYRGRHADCLSQLHGAQQKRRRGPGGHQGLDLR